MANAAEHQDLLRTEQARAEELGTTVRQAYLDLAHRSHALLEATSALEQELETARGRVAASDSERQAQAGTILRLQAQIAQLTLDVEHAQQDAVTLQERLREAAGRRTSLETEARTQAARLADLQQELATARHELDFARGDADTLRAQLVESQGRRSALESERKELASQLAGERDRHERLREESLQAKRHLEQRTALIERRRRGDLELQAEAQRLLALDPEFSEQAVHLSGEENGGDEHADEALPVRLSGVLAHVGRTWQARQEDFRIQGERLAELERKLEASEQAQSELQAEHDDLAASGKEVIGQLTIQRDTRERELVETRNALVDSQHRAGGLQRSLVEASSIIRRLGDALSAAAGRMGEPALELDLALSRLPDQDEVEVEPALESMTQCGEAANALIAGMLTRHQGLAANHERVHHDAAQLRERQELLSRELFAAQTQIQEREAEVRRHQGEVTAIRREMAEQGAQLAAKTQELSATRAELVAHQADIEAERLRVREHERRHQELSAHLGERTGEAVRVAEERDALRKRCDHVEGTLAGVASAFASLTSSSSPASAGEPLARATQKFDLARSHGGDELLEAGKGLALALQERSRHLAERLSAAHLEISRHHEEHERLANALAGAQAANVDREGRLAEQVAAHERMRVEHDSLLEQLLASRTLHDQRLLQIDELKNQLRFTQAELEGVRASDQAASGYSSEELTALKQRLGEQEQAARTHDIELQELRERLEAADVRLRRTREEFQKMLEERDRMIREKDQLLDDVGAKRVDFKGLEAQARAMADQLGAANDRIKELEAAMGINAGAGVKSSDLARELRKAQADRDGLRDRQRQLESDLADSLSQHAESSTQLEEKRKEVAALREQFNRESAEERERTSSLREEFRKLKEEVVGLRARLRRLTDGR